LSSEAPGAPVWSSSGPIPDGLGDWNLAEDREHFDDDYATLP